MQKKFIIPILLPILIVSASLNAQYQERLYFGAKFEPVDKIIHGAGQSDEFALASYIEVLGTTRHPMLYMEYMGVDFDTLGIKEELDKYKRVLGHYPKSVGLQLGLSLRDGGASVCTDIANGLYDEGLHIIARSLDSLDRPVLVRIGYEANGFWNDYSSDPYKSAFKHVTDILRAQTDSIATVWCVHPVDNMTKIMKYYPGDEYVDWWSIDLFQKEFITNSTTSQFMDSAQTHNKPVIIGESTPTHSGVGDGQASWDNWYEVYFNVIRNEPVIKGFCYINRNWDHASSHDWGNALIQDDSIVACHYRDEMSSEIYLHANASRENNISTIIASEDAFVESGTPNANYGNNDMLYAHNSTTGYDTISYFKFDLKGIPLGEISLAQAWILGACSHEDNQDIDVYLTSSNWDEATINWNNKPATIQKLETINVNDEKKSKIYSIDITPILLDSLKAGKKEISLAIANPAVDDVQYFFHSKEMEPIYPPTLQIIHNSDRLRYNKCQEALDTSLVTGTKKIYCKQGDSLALTADPTTDSVFKYTWDTLNNQKWKVSSFSNGYFKIENLSTGKALKRDSTAKGSNVILSDFQDIDEFMWEIEYFADGFYKLKSKDTNLLMEANGTTDSTNVTVNIDGEQNWQLWTFENTGEATPPVRATQPYPTDRAVGLDTALILHWESGKNALIHRIYFGKTNNPEYLTSIQNSEYEINGLDLNTTYYWRIDEANNYDTTIGEVWSFTTKDSADMPVNVIRQNISEELIVYPNPTSGILHIESFTNKIGKIEVYSIEGKTVKRFNSETESIMIDLTDQPKGFYIISCNTPNRTHRVKVFLH